MSRLKISTHSLVHPVLSINLVYIQHAVTQCCNWSLFRFGEHFDSYWFGELSLPRVPRSLIVLQQLQLNTQYLDVATCYRTLELWSAATCLTRTRSVICNNGQCKQMSSFRWPFQPKSLARTQTWDRQFAQLSVLSSGDQRAICHVIETD